MDEILDACFAGSFVRTVTMNLVEHLMLDEPLTPSETIDFGVDSEHHYRALQIMLRDTCSGWDEAVDAEGYGNILLLLHSIITELDRALGDGAKLNALVRKYVPEYADCASFETTWDKLLGRSLPKTAETSTSL